MKLFAQLLLLLTIGGATLAAESNLVIQTTSGESEKKEIALLAAGLANTRALKLFGAEPFSANDGQPTLASNVWTWIAVKGYAAGDIRATVTITSDRQNHTVELEQIISKFDSLPPDGR